MHLIGNHRAMLASKPAWLLPGNPSLQLDLDARRAWLNGRAYYDETSIKALFSTFSTPSHYATGKDGVLYPIPANSIDSFYMPVGTSWGQLIEEARQTIAVYSRTLDTLAWTSDGITLTPAVGADGVLGSAVKLTATKNNATILAPAITSASAARRFAPYVRRITGNGNIYATLDGGTGWTTLSGITNSYTRQGIGQTVANPRVGIRIATNGDEVLIDFANGEIGAFDTSPIATTNTQVTRAASSIIAADGTPLATAVQQAKAAYFRTYGVAGGQAPRLLATDGGALIYFSQSYATTIQTPSNMATAAIGGSGTYAGIVKSAFGMDAASITAKANGGMPATQATAWAGNTGNINFGNVAAGNRALNGYLSQGVFGNTKGTFDALAVAP